MPANVIPPMIHRPSTYWIQPDRSEILLGDNYAVMTQAAFDKLPVYNASIPSGVYEGKMWKTQCIDGRVLRWYADPIGDEMMIYFRYIKICRQSISKVRKIAC